MKDKKFLTIAETLRLLEIDKAQLEKLMRMQLLKCFVENNLPGFWYQDIERLRSQKHLSPKSG